MIGDRFAIEGRTGAGGMGTVYAAHDHQTGRRVAVKLVRERQPEDGERFLRECEVLATLAHPRIVRHVAHGRAADGSLFLAMEWADGVTLQERLAGAGLTVAEAVEVARRVADGLAEVHARGLVHRDIKPSNVIFRGGDLAGVTVIDFGLARPVASGVNLTETGAVVGTPSYMSPEQVRGERRVDARADVFALGCLLYEALTGRVVFGGRRFLALKAKILLWHPPRPSALAPEVPPALDELVLAMLAKDPRQRPRDGAEVARRLSALGPIASGGPTRPRRHDEPPTVVEEAAPERVAVVVATTLDATGDAPASPPKDLAALRRSFEDALGAAAACLEVLDDGSAIATLESSADAVELARRAATCALAIRDAHPGLIVGMGAAGGRDRIVEDVAQGMARDAMSMLFAAATDVPADGVWIDRATAALLERDFVVVQVRDSSYLRGPRA